MTAAYSDLFMEQGADFSTSLTLDDVYGNLYDLNNYIAGGQMKKSYYSLSPTANLIVTIPNTTQGIIVLSLDAANTSNIMPGRYVYDVLMRDTANNVTTRIIEGIVNVSPQVTVL
jgi:hypothetical protein